ncbi:helix-turn-helix domain-containing protein [Streptomyces sp. NBC_00342]|uniref:helix-turn-helix domain-containing protein n=1 Tax=Streptomyces sp. NBC_00342 TaxID=2975718 RepID=UPI002E2E15F3|nr:helix-turn-helix transcriptional regulator [Streptomyces sp. NBC_00342]
MDRPTLPVSERIRQRRIEQGRTQAVVAGLCGISTEYLSQIERGLKTPARAVMARLAAELGLPVGTLMAGADEVMAPLPPVVGSRVAQALLVQHRPPSTPLTASSLRNRVKSLWDIWQSSPTRFTVAESLLPDLIRDIEGTSRALRVSPDASERREVLRSTADLYGMLRSYCRRAGRMDLALVSADRALHAAEDADDALRIAVAHWNLGHVLLSQPGSEADAVDVAMTAAAQLDREPGATKETVAVQGALELVVAVAEAKANRSWAARERLNSVLPLAKRTGDGNVLWTVFGPTNVQLHALSVEMTDGDALEGLRLADHVDTSRIPSNERNFTFGMEVAACYDLRRDYAAVLVHLLELEQLAPEDLDRSPLARSLAMSLVRKARPTYRRQAVALAERLQLL